MSKQQPPPHSPRTIFERYIEAANRHDLESIRVMTAEDAIWHLGPDTLIGREEVLRPLAFDEGANTVLEAGNIIVEGDTIVYELIERNDVLEALGIPALHHFGRMVIRDGLIYRKGSERLPLEQEAFVESVVSFKRWLQEHRPQAYDRLWPGGSLTIHVAWGERCRA